MSASHIFFSNDKYEIRPAHSSAEYKHLWWTFMHDLGWNRGYYDLESYMNPSSGSGMILLIDKAKNEPVGHIAAVANSNRTGWIAMFIIEASHRGKGLGAELFRAALKDARDTGIEILGLDAVAEQKATYERRGFVESTLGPMDVMTRPLVSAEGIPDILKITPEEGTHLLDIHDVKFQLLAEHEAKYTGFLRPKLWSNDHMFHRPDVLGFVLASTSTPKHVDDILSWTIVRRCSGGARIGPIYAGSVRQAQLITVQAMQAASAKWIAEIQLPDEPMNSLSEDEISKQATLVLEAWTGNAESVKLFEAAGFQKQLSFHRMWVDEKAAQQQSEGGIAQTGLFAIFDAAVG